MITKEQLQTMSDFDVNKALTELIGHSYVRTFNSLAPSLILVSGINQADGSRHQFCVDYCKEPNDIMPLAFEHKLEIDWFADGRCLVGAGDFMYQSTNPLRAIACCLILVLQEKKL